VFRSRLENLIAPRHPLVRVAERIDWDAMDECVGAHYEDAEVGRPPKPIPPMAGLPNLKHACSLSDEALVERWVENPYWQACCGGSTFRTRRRFTRSA
jgi:transposase, IS5 family